MTRLPTGRFIAAARILVGLGQRELAEKAGVHASTIARIEHQGRDETLGTAKTVTAILDALRDEGVEVTHDTLRVIPKKRKAR